MRNGIKRVFLLVVDSFGIGGASDAADYGDAGSDTYKSISGGISAPNMAALGLNNIDGVDAAPKAPNPKGQYARLIEKSVGKDTVTGHFEIAGLVSPKPQPLFPDGFPKEIVDKLESAFGRKTLGNCAASGTEIIKRLGEQSTAEAKPIIYTSADSVLQIAANEDVIPLSELYTMCEKARQIMSGDYAVGRVIARPFKRGAEGFYRTENRRDYSLPPHDETMLDRLKARGFAVKGVGKIKDIFSGRGLTEHIEAHSNDEAYGAVINELDKDFTGLVFVNLVDTDMLFGHRNDIEGYRKCVERFDEFLGRLMDRMRADDAVIVTADHGCDPATPSTDHSRENVPYLYWHKNITPQNLGTILGFDFVAQTIEKLLVLD
jgi:phosphopentomutase